MHRLSLLLLLSPLPYAAAQEALARVEVKGAVDRPDTAAASKVVGRAEIAAYGDNNLADVLKRQGGISVVGNEVRMRGLGNGYTQILVDGEPVPQGFSIDAIAPELVERIEIARSPTADRSTQAVAGSINIVLRKRSGGRREDKVSSGYQHGEWSPSASTQVSGKRGNLAWSAGAAFERTVRIDSVLTDETVAEAGVTTEARRFIESGLARIDRLNLTPRLNWTFENGETLGWNALLGLVRSQGATAADEATLRGPPTDYPASSAGMGSRVANLRSDLAWAHRFTGAGKLTVKGVVDTSRRRGDYLFLGTRPSGEPGLARAVASGADERTASLNGKYLAPLGAAHSLGLGWDASRTTRSEHRNQTDTLGGVPNAALRLQDYTARVERLALFAQDEWTISDAFEGYAGLRWEGLRTGTDGADLARVATSSSVASPILQLLWKLPDKNQLRLALARTYKAPLTSNLVPRRYTINNNNGPANPDAEGNPDLRPELSWGLDLAWERPLGKGGTATLSGYVKRVSDVTTGQLYRDGASWVARPINNGDADLAGIEADLKSPVKFGAMAFELRLNAGRNWSRVRHVPGPDNTLAEQVPFTANAGIDYRGAGWDAGANVNLRASARSRSSDGVTTWADRLALLDLYWTRKLDAQWRVRVSVVNALGQVRRAGTVYLGADGSSVTRALAWDGMASMRLGLERAL
ncbi:MULTISPECIES: TonB-dependent siderophore receptor [unclassified Massilia]|uniref:TonB-dependent receptor plug domain-containing protein n=1 Tax=unclassified Massilia TaxID=2609279 RepID=UPI00178686D1|nr:MULTISPECIES: TonB-dependent receptor [unclassified Massilia]MBD8532428.1 TonB-dependent receptor [Massilia sp. CFBP 13647]MBD8675746.1 TonB-dependent receptor [Massilia sp. CFBP 13721]